MTSTEEMMAMAAEACGAHPDMMVGEAMGDAAWRRAGRADVVRFERDLP